MGTGHLSAIVKCVGFFDFWQNNTHPRGGILEFKLDDTAANALKQIKEKGYAEPYATSPKGVTLLGVGFSSEQRTITDTLDEVLR